VACARQCQSARECAQSPERVLGSTQSGPGQAQNQASWARAGTPRVQSPPILSLNSDRDMPNANCIVLVQPTRNELPYLIPPQAQPSRGAASGLGGGESLLAFHLVPPTSAFYSTVA
jgi:hypothetical protein